MGGEAFQILLTFITIKLCGNCLKYDYCGAWKDEMILCCLQMLMWYQTVTECVKKEPVSAEPQTQHLIFGEKAKRGALKCRGTFSSLICSLFACLFILADLVPALLSCSAPDLLAGGLPLWQRQMHPTLLALWWWQRLRGRLGWTGLSWVFLFFTSQQQTHHHPASSAWLINADRCDAVLRGQHCHGQPPLTFAQIVLLFFYLWNCVYMRIHPHKTNPAVC